MNAGLWGRGGGRHSDFSMVSMCLPFWKPVRLDLNWGIIHECSRTYRKQCHTFFWLYYLLVRAVYYGNPFDFYPFNTNDHRYPYLSSIYKCKYLDCKCRYLYFKFLNVDISFPYKIEISTFKIEISVFKNKNRCLYLRQRYIYLKYRYLYFKCRNL